MFEFEIVLAKKFPFVQKRDGLHYVIYIPREDCSWLSLNLFTLLNMLDSSGRKRR